MVRKKEGCRVGAISHSEDNKIILFGYGVYQGDKVLTDIEKDQRPSGMMGEMLIEAGIPNPCILLDDGNYVWGCECWWGTEEEVKKQVEKYDTIKYCSIIETRKKFTK